MLWNRLIKPLVLVGAVVFLAAFDHSPEPPPFLSDFYPRILAIHFLGIEERDNARGFVLEKFDGIDPRIHRIRLSEERQEVPSLKELKATFGRYLPEGLILEVIVYYPGWMQEEQRWGQEPYPGVQPYSTSVKGMMDLLPQKFARLIGEFQREYPETMTVAFGVSIGSELLWKTARHMRERFDQMYLISPPLTLAQEPEPFLKALKQHSYLQREVVVSVEKGTPITELFEKLKADHPKAFHLFVMDFREKPEGELRRYWGAR